MQSTLPKYFTANRRVSTMRIWNGQRRSRISPQQRIRQYGEEVLVSPLHVLDVLGVAAP